MDTRSSTSVKSLRMGLENPPDSSYELHEYWPALAPDRQPYLVEQILQHRSTCFPIVIFRATPETPTDPINPTSPHPPSPFRFGRLPRCVRGRHRCRTRLPPQGTSLGRPNHSGLHNSNTTLFSSRFLLPTRRNVQLLKLPLRNVLSIRFLSEFDGAQRHTLLYSHRIVYVRGARYTASSAPAQTSTNALD